jgi:hypothetical protein
LIEFPENLPRVLGGDADAGIQYLNFYINTAPPAPDRHAPLSDEELEDKFFDNALYGGWNEALAKCAGDGCRDAFESDASRAVAAFRA